MPKHKAAQNCKILDWLSANQDNTEGRFLQVGNSMLLSAKFQALSPSVQMLYLSCAMESGGKREFTFSEACAAKYGISRSSLRRGIAELIRAGLIEHSTTERTIGQAYQYRFTVAGLKER